MRDAVAIVPPVAWLAVWNRNIVIDRKQEKGKEQRGHEDVQSQDDEEDDDNDNSDRDRSGVLYSRIYRSDGGAHGDTENDRIQRDLLTRRIGLAQGLIDFTRSFASKKPRRHHHDSEDEPEEDIDSTKEIKVVHSQNQRLVFIQPEENYWIVGAVDRYITPAQSTEARERATASTASASSSNKDKQKKSMGQSQTRLQPSSFLRNEVLTDLLRRAYAEFRLFHGTFGSILESEGVNTLRAGLATFFDTWRYEARLIPLGLPKAVGLPNEDDFPSPPANFTIVAVSQSGLIDIPSITKSTLTPSDRLALAYHLASILPKPTPPPVPSASASSQKKKKVKKQPSLSASTWKSLNLGGISSYLPSMPSMPGSSSSSSVLQKSSTGTGEALPKSATAKSSSLGSVPSQQVDPPISTDSQSGKRTSSGSAWMPSFNLFGGANKVKPKESESKGSTEHAEGLPETSETSLQASDGEPSSEQTEVNPLVEPRDTAPSEASLEALSEALIENISPQVLPPVADTSPSSGPPGVAKTSAQAGTPAETIREENIQTTCTWHTVRDVFVGQNGAQQRCHCVHNEDIAVAFVEAIDGYSCSNERSMDPFNHTEAGAYLRDLAKVVIPGSKRERDDSSRARTYLRFASSDCNQVQEQVIDDRASASTASLGQRFNLALTGKTDSDKLMKPGVTEVFVRTFFSQWLVAQRDDTQDTHTKVTILPKSIGKEGSLVDADAEMRRLAQK